MCQIKLQISKVVSDFNPLIRLCGFSGSGWDLSEIFDFSQVLLFDWIYKES